MGVGLGEVAQLPVGDRVEHLGKEAQVVGLFCNHFVEVIETAVSLAGVNQVSDEPEAEQGEGALLLALQPVVRFSGR